MSTGRPSRQVREGWRTWAWWRTLAWRGARVVLLALLAVSGALLLFQHGLIYLARAYPAGLPLRAGIERLEFTTPEGRQVCWWVPGSGPRSGPGSRVWLCFAGNASLARTWVDLLPVPSATAGLLLIEYPGYGESAGSASAASVLVVSEGAVAALRARLGDLPAETGVLGHSLGAAMALQYAARHPVQRVVLVAPFTRMLDMARMVVGWPLCHLLLHRYDNQARLAEILRPGTDPAPRIDLFHGTADEVIPLAMGRALATQFPAIHYHEIAGADHNGILVEIAATLTDLL